MESFFGYLDYLRIFPFALQPKLLKNIMYFVANHLKDSTSQTSLSECSPRGSRLPRTVPSNRVGS